MSLLLTCPTTLLWNSVQEGSYDVRVVVGRVASTYVEQEVDPDQVHIVQT